MKRKVSSAGADVARVTWNVISRVCRHWHARLLVHANRFWHQHQHHTEEVRWGGSPNLALSSILMFLVDLDIHQIAGYHYFVHHLPSRGAPTTPPITIMMKLAHQIVTCKPILTPLPPPWTTTPMTPTRPPHWQACCKQTDFDKQEFCKKIWKLKFHVTRNHRKEIVMTRNATGTGWRFSMGRSLLKICKRNLRWIFVEKIFWNICLKFFWKICLWNFENFIQNLLEHLSRICWNISEEYFGKLLDRKTLYPSLIVTLEFDNDGDSNFSPAWC